MSKLIWRGIGSAAELFAPIQQVKDARNVNYSEAATEQPSTDIKQALTDYERMLIAMHEYPEISEQVQVIAESVEIGELSEERALDLIANMAFLAISTELESLYP